MRPQGIKRPFNLIALAVLVVLLGACRSQPAGPAGEAVKLRMAVLPILDTLPMYVAQQQGLFEKYGVQVELIPVQSAPERDQLVAAGQADGMINEPLSAMFFNRDEVQVQIVRFARAATSEVRLFSILASPQSGISGPEGLKNVEIGVSKGTVIEYLTDRLLQAEGLAEGEIKTISVPDLGERMELIVNGQLKAGTLPEPLTSLALQRGAVLVLADTSHPEYSFSVYSFRKTVIDEHPEAVRGFLAALEEAVVLINRDGAQFSSLLTDQKLVPPPLVGSFDVPTFVTAGVPTEEQWNDTLDWAVQEGLLENRLPYEQTVTESFLPR